MAPRIDRTRIRRPLTAALLLTASVFTARAGMAQAVPPAPAPAAPAPAAPAPAMPRAEEAADGRLARTVAVEVRAATVSALLASLTNSLGITMQGDRDVAGERIHLYAADAKVGGLQQALASLYQTGWSTAGAGEETAYRLRSHAPLLARAEQLRALRRSQFLARLLDLEREVGGGGAESAAARLQAALASRRPNLPASSIAQITPDYVRQALLLAPARFGLLPSLSRTDAAWTPLARLSPVQQRLVSAFYLQQAGAFGVEAAQDAEPAPARAALDPAALEWPRARLEYRLLYGDRWSGNLLLTRVGTSDSWANSALSSALFDLPDYASLYPDAGVRPVDTVLYRPTTLKIDPAVQTWDQALGAISRGAKINVVSDVYLRPDVFRPSEPSGIIEGATLINLLDNVAEHYGYVWWKQGDWYLFRHRMWAEERRVSVPERVFQIMGSSLAAGEHLSAEAITGLAALSEEQLLTMHLYGSAEGRADAPPEKFNLEEAALARAGLMLVSQMTDSQRELARGQGLPYLLMSPVQQFMFASLAYDRGINPEAFDLQTWGFALSDRFERRRVGAGWAEMGEIRIDFNAGEAGVRTVTLAARAPALERQQPREETRE